jgi:hypothetical protein
MATMKAFLNESNEMLEGQPPSEAELDEILFNLYRDTTRKSNFVNQGLQMRLGLITQELEKYWMEFFQSDPRSSDLKPQNK